MIADYINQCSVLQIILLTLSGVLVVVSAFFESRQKSNTAIIVLAVAALCYFSFDCLLDPFLNLWDERFHALVARNMSSHMLLPTLYDQQILALEAVDWSGQHVWLHKQPWFLWQMALSIKVFGATEFAIRFPDVMLGLAMIFVLFRSGKILFSARAGYIASLLFLSSFYINELIAGRQMLDHNDFSFLCYVSFSLWSWLEYNNSGQKKWIVLIGLFAGVAILNKWLVGLLVYLAWFVMKMLNKQFRPKQYVDMIIAFSITAAVSLPWQFYILSNFPVEAKKEYAYNALHFTEVVEGHSGDVYFHFKSAQLIYGEFFCYFLLIAWLLAFYKLKDKKVLLSMLGIVVFVYTFFTMAKTKMPSFTAVLMLPMLIVVGASLAWIIDSFFSRIKTRWSSFFVYLVLISIVVVRISPEKIVAAHSLSHPDNSYSRMLKHNRDIFLNLDLPQRAVIMNAGSGTYLDAMFYTGLPAYDFLPDTLQLQQLVEGGYKPVIFQKNEQAIPPFLMTDSNVIILNEKLMYAY